MTRDNEPQTSDRSGDVIAAQVGGDISGSGNVVASKNVIQIGSLNVPRWLAFAVAGLLALIVVAVVWFGLISGQRGQALQKTTDDIQKTTGQVAGNTEEILETVKATPTATPIPKMSGAIFNIAVAEFVQRAADGEPAPSDAGEKLAGLVFNALNDAYEENEQLAFGSRGNVEIRLVDDAESRAITDGSLIVDEASAELLATQLGANMVVMGLLSDEEEPGALELGFYYRYPYLSSQPDAVAGRHRLGGPLPFDTAAQPETAIFAINEPLSLRSEVLFRVTVGLTYDVNGKYGQALEVFQDTAEFLEQINGGSADVDLLKEVVYYFLGREALQVRDYETAVEAFDKALALNDEYAAAYVGRGGIAFDQAQLFYVRPEDLAGGLEQCVVEDDLAEAAARVESEDAALAKIDQALLDYQRAVEVADAEANASLRPLTQVALALGYRLQGQAYDSADQRDLASESYQNALDALDAVLPALETAGLLQPLGLGYLSMGVLHHSLGSLHARSQAPEASVAAFDEALKYYRMCIDLEPDADPFLRQQIIECSCEPYEEQVEKSLIQLGGGSG